MMTRPKIFIASSSEGLDVAKTVRGLLVQELGDKAEVALWTWEFELSATYIESLEKVCHEFDFAVFVLTPDDLTSSREIDKLAPRDNVVFELGLFIGSLGRERCFIVHEQRADLKLPTDLLGVNAATFKLPSDRNLKAALDAKCLSICERITKLGNRYKSSAYAVEAQMAIRSFYERVRGAWWECCNVDRDRWISYFQIECDDIYGLVQMRGRSYNAAGSLLTHWNGSVVRIQKDEKKILYHWQGWYPASPSDRFHGFGEMEFEDVSESGEMINRGHGRFWDVDEAHPERTVVKPVELRRILDENEIATMARGREKDVQTLVQKTMSDW